MLPHLPAIFRSVLAVENMIESCVRETYGALVAAYQT